MIGDEFGLENRRWVENLNLLADMTGADDPNTVYMRILEMMVEGVRNGYVVDTPGKFVDEYKTFVPMSVNNGSSGNRLCICTDYFYTDKIEMTAGIELGKLLKMVAEDDFFSGIVLNPFKEKSFQLDLIAIRAVLETAT